MAKFIGFIFGCLVALIWIGCVTIIQAVGFAYLWNWFVVTSFAAPHMGIPLACGLMLLVRYFKERPKLSVYLAEQRRTKTTEESINVLKDAAYEIFAVPLIFLAFGWIVFQWMPKTEVVPPAIPATVESVTKITG